MKKVLTIIVAVLLIAVMSVCLVACGKTAATPLLFGKELLTLPAQVDILTQLKNGSADIGVMDSIMANYYMTTGTYANDLQLIEGVILAEEEYGIAAKKGNASLVSKLNESLIALSANSTLASTASPYGLENEVLVNGSTTNPITTTTDGAWNAIVASKKLIIGYTTFAPIAFDDDKIVGDDKLTGFDIELARAVVAYLNTTYSAKIAIEFQPITWAQKETMLENGSIDLVWNGMTITEERLASMEISVPYLANKQAAVIRKTDAEKYGDIAAFLKNTKNAVVAVEGGSAAQDCMEMR